MAKRSIQEINAGSMADIAFLLLIFFLVTTTMSTDMGIIRKLPPLKQPEATVLHKRDVLNVRINRENQILAKDRLIQLSELKELAKEFIENPLNNSKLPELKLKHINGLGEISYTSQHVISLMNDRGTSYKVYVAVQNELAAAYNELKNDFALKRWQTNYGDLDKSRKKAVDEVYKMKISEADPVEVASIK